MHIQRSFVILDRDGTLNVDRHYLADANDLELLPGVCRGLRRLRALGLGLVVVTNQSAIGKGIIDHDKLDEIHARLRMLLLDEDIELDGIYACPHDPDKDGPCHCRKPAPGLIEDAVNDLGFDPKASFMIGDSSSDIECGRGVGAFTILVRTGYGMETEKRDDVFPDKVVDDFEAASRLIESELPLDPDRM